MVAGKKTIVERDEPLTIKDLLRMHALLESEDEPLWVVGAHVGRFCVVLLVCSLPME